VTQQWLYIRFSVARVLCIGAAADFVCGAAWRLCGFIKPDQSLFVRSLFRLTNQCFYYPFTGRQYWG